MKKGDDVVKSKNCKIFPLGVGYVPSDEFLFLAGSAYNLPFSFELSK